MHPPSAAHRSTDQLISERLLGYFHGTVPPQALLDWIARRGLGGVTLFRHDNGAPPAETLALTTALQAAARAAGQSPLLICTDQEGGQLQAVPGVTAFPGNMALGAAGDPELARRVGAAIGRELAAMGVNVNYAPACDVNVNPRNPVIGVRAFGEDPTLVGRLAAAMVVGLQAEGVAATAKHFPGHGDTASDSHHGLAVVPHSRERLDRLELPPFAAAIAAGARLVLSAHLDVPALTGVPGSSALCSPAVLGDLLRGELGFAGVTVTDALNMAGFAAGADPGDAYVAAAAAGQDLLLLAEGNSLEGAFDALLGAARTGRLPEAGLRDAAGRVLALKAWLATFTPPDLAVVGCAEHRALAAEVAARALTLVRAAPGALPLRPAAEARLIVAVPATADLTPADTSSLERCELAAAVRAYHPRTDELTIPADPSPAEVAALVERLTAYDHAIVGTINAGERPGQAALVRELVRRGAPLVTVALRLPYDLAAYPEAPTHLCAYSILRPMMDAVAAALFGAGPAPGRLPVSIPGLAPIGHRVDA